MANLPSVDITTEPAFPNPLALTDTYLGVQDGDLGQGELQDVKSLFDVTPIATNVQTGTSYTLQASDNGKVIVFTNGSAITITLPEQGTTALPVGFNCLVRTAGAGAGTFQTEGSDTKTGNAGTGANATNDAGVVLRATSGGVNTWDIFGGV